MEKLKVIIVMPAYNAEKTLKKTILDIPFEYVDEIILVDDASKDNTVEVANKLKDEYFKFFSKSIYKEDFKNRCIFSIESLDINRGYGGNQKKCYSLALSHGADIVIMLHPDFQYDPKMIKYFIEFIKDDISDVVLGSRIRSRKEALEGGMPVYKYYANRFLTLIQNIASGQTLSEWHTGMRAYKREVLENIDYNKFSDDFIFDGQMLFAIVDKNYKIGEVPVPVRYFKEASSINFKRSLRYGILILWETIKFLIRRVNNLKKFFQLIRYLFAGSSAFIVNVSIYSLFLFYFNVLYVYSAIISFLFGALVSFSLQKYWVFEQKLLKNTKRQFLLYIVLLLFNLYLNVFLLFVLVEKLSFSKFHAQIISISIIAFLSFFFYKYVVFKNR